LLDYNTLATSYRIRSDRFYHCTEPPKGLLYVPSHGRGVMPCSWSAATVEGALIRERDRRICCAGVQGEAVESMPSDLVQLHTRSSGRRHENGQLKICSRLTDDSCLGQTFTTIRGLAR